ncbi:hypothetical protein [Trueperella pecoris]|uniref:hypothetical protein n=1 Tax=Trueperella pecoris TaxID=2733571 RepID=UPI001ABE958F|nr:hypothetical protein [Trueperella pecoris]QTG75608.1 hypothetical protein J4179_00565 [Trueperella pecoris]
MSPRRTAKHQEAIVPALRQSHPGLKLMQTVEPDSDLGLDWHLANAEAEYSLIRASVLRIGESSAPHKRAFARAAANAGLEVLQEGLAILPIPNDLKPWEVERQKILRQVAFIESKRARHQSQRQVAYAGPTAATLLGLPLFNKHPHRLFRVGTPEHCASQTPRVRTLRPSTPPDTFEFAGMLVSSPAQTVVDLAHWFSLEDALVCADFVLHNKLATREQIVAIAESMPRVPNIRRIRKVITLMDGRAESPGESMTRLRVHETLNDDFEPQVIFPFKNNQYRIDGLLRRSAVILEFDGRAKITDIAKREGRSFQQVLNDETHRERQLRRAGYHVHRLEWPDIVSPQNFHRWLEGQHLLGLVK